MSDSFPNSPTTPNILSTIPKFRPTSPGSQFPICNAQKEIEEIEANHGALPDTAAVRALREQLEQTAGKYELCRGERQDLWQKLAHVDGPDESDMDRRTALADTTKELWQKFVAETTRMRADFRELLDDPHDDDLWIPFRDKLKKHFGENTRTGVTDTARKLLLSESRIVEWEQKFQKRASLRAEEAEKNNRKLTSDNEALVKKNAELEGKRKKLQQKIDTTIEIVKRAQKRVDNDMLGSGIVDNNIDTCEQRCQKLELELFRANREAARYQNETANFIKLADDTIVKLGGTPPSRHISEVRSPALPAFSHTRTAMQIPEKNASIGLTDEEIGGMLDSWKAGHRNIEELLKRNSHLENLLKERHDGREGDPNDGGRDLNHLPRGGDSSSMLENDEAIDRAFRREVERRLADAEEQQDQDRAQVKICEILKKKFEKGETLFQIIEEYEDDGKYYFERDDKQVEEIESLELELRRAQKQVNDNNGRTFQVVSLEEVRRKLQELGSGAEYDWYRWLAKQMESGTTLIDILRKGTQEHHEYLQQIKTLTKTAQDLETIINGRLDNPTTDGKLKEYIENLKNRLTEATQLAKAAQGLRDEIERIKKKAATDDHDHEIERRVLEEQIEKLTENTRKADGRSDKSAQIQRLEQDLKDLGQRSKNTIVQMEAKIARLQRENELKNGKTPTGHQSTKDQMIVSTLAYLQLQIDDFERRRNDAESIHEAKRVERFTEQIAFLKEVQAELLADKPPNDVLELLWKYRSVLDDRTRRLDAPLESPENRNAVVVSGDKKAIYIAQSREYFKAKLLETISKAKLYQHQNGGSISEDLGRMLKMCKEAVAALSTGKEDPIDLLVNFAKIVAVLGEDIDRLEDEVDDLGARLSKASRNGHAASSRNSDAAGSQDDSEVADLQQQIQQCQDTTEGLQAELTSWREGRITAHATQKQLDDGAAKIVELTAKTAFQAEQIEQLLNATYELQNHLPQKEKYDKGQQDGAPGSQSMDVNNSQPERFGGPSASLPLREFVRLLQERIASLEGKIETVKRDHNQEETQLYARVRALSTELRNLRVSDPEVGDVDPAEARKQNETRAAEIENLQKKMQDRDTQLKKLLEDCSRLKAEIEELKGGKEREENPERGTLQHQIKQLQKKLAECEKRHEGTSTINNNGETEALQAEVVQLREKVKFCTLTHVDQAQQEPLSQSDIESRQSYIKKIAKLEAKIKKHYDRIKALKTSNPGTPRGRENIMKDMVIRQDAQIEALEETIEKHEKEIQEPKKSNADYEEVTANFTALLNDGPNNDTELEHARLNLEQQVKDLEATRQKRLEERAPSRSPSPRAVQEGRSGNFAPRGEVVPFGEDGAPIFGSDEETPVSRGLVETVEEDQEELRAIEGLETTINDMKSEELRLRDRIQQQEIEIQALGSGGDKGLRAQIKVLKQRIAELEEKLKDCKLFPLRRRILLIDNNRLQ